MPKIKAVIFDIDGTLSEKNSWASLAVGMGGTHAEDLEIVELQKAKKITDEEADRRILTVWQRHGLARKVNFEEIFKSIPLRHDATDLVNYLKLKGIIICLITGSMDMYAKIVADKLTVDNYYANTKLFWNDKDEIINFKYTANQGALKLDQFNEFIFKNNLKAGECAAIGDSENDYLLFLETKHGIAVKTEFEDKILEAAAWKVVNNLSEIKEIIK